MSYKEKIELFLVIELILLTFGLMCLAAFEIIPEQFFWYIYCFFAGFAFSGLVRGHK